MDNKMILGFALVALTTGSLAATLPLPDDVARAEAEAVLSKLTLEQKVSLTGGCATMYLTAIPEAGIDREWAMSDCSHAMKPEHGRAHWAYVTNVDDRSTALAPLSAVACTWNRDLAALHGDVMGEQMRARGKDQMLGPGVNINRTPLCGRNWEYMSEDPYLTAQLVVPLIRSVQRHGVAATVKHFAVNDQELDRNKVDVVVDERTLHEIYFPAFRAAIREGGVLAVMTAYNKLNGEHCSENDYLQRGILRDRWGFMGQIVTDWGGQHSTVRAALNGGDLEMHEGAGIRYFTDYYNTNNVPFPLLTAVKEGKVPEATVDEMVYHTLFTMAKTGFFDKVQDPGERLTEKHQQAARTIGEEAIVLLKNEKNVLPLDRKTVKSIAVVGLAADLKQAHLGCSCEAHPCYEITPLAGLRAYLGPEVSVTLYPLGEAERNAQTNAVSEEQLALMRVAGGSGEGLNAEETRPKFTAAEIAAACRAADVVIVFTGTTMGYGRAHETEAGDRPDMSLPEGHDAAIAEILSWNLPKTVVINRSGAFSELPWADRCATLVHMPYLGQEAGRPLARTLFGEVNPSGKLTATWPRRYADLGVAQMGTYGATNVIYNERFYVGYRWFDEKGIAPLFPFGYGLSYTAFAYGRATVRLGRAVTPSPLDSLAWTVFVPVTNAGKVAGKEIVELYVEPVAHPVERVKKELKGFVKLALAPGETKEATFTVTPRDLAYYDVLTHRWRTLAGEYRLRVGGSSADLPAAVTVTVPKTILFNE